jgi:hypothetical protein
MAHPFLMTKALDVPLMNFTFLHWISKHLPKADKSAMAAINRALQMSGFFCEVEYKARGSRKKSSKGTMRREAQCGNVRMQRKQDLSSSFGTLGAAEKILGHYLPRKPVALTTETASSPQQEER